MIDQVGTRMFHPNVALAIGVAVAAVVIAQIVLRVRWALAEAATDRKIAALSVLQRDPTLERQAEASAQVFPVGARICTKAHGVATVVVFNEEAKTYDVEPLRRKDEAKEPSVVTLTEQDIHVPEVAEFVVYPVKSCAGIRLDSVDITCTYDCVSEAA